MMDWFSTLELFSKFYWIIALIGSLFFLFIVITTFIGADTGDDLDELDPGIESDTGIEFQFITFKNLIGFFTLFGWSGIACIDAGLSKPVTVIISLFSGLLMMTIMSAMFYYTRKLTSSGTLVYKNAIGAVGEVYLTIGANRSKIGKVSVNVQGSLRELDALTDSSVELKSGSVINVLDVTANGVLIVASQNKKQI
ncbi:hypothetical protein SAMN04487989_101487 [Bizionia echini]|uniref:NfeD-like C-terminal, partner-binding n=1 Tax=Bizionia echini TaxID=649333 RepID=A0A1I4Z3G6_9FLAO|nr:hypothetical protein [Bizionia echini]SFN44825.1 hypothetical protein SAMN04487989_101487 [Bizionia echini]|tara:strand:- start:659 stop:1246 length:588 start_codon:yes stop_codon:yes gene_type:complete